MSEPLSESTELEPMDVEAIEPLPLPATISAEAAADLLGETKIAGAPSAHLAAFNPKNLEEARWIAASVAKSGIVPDALKNNPGAVLAVMARGAQLGIHWSVAVQTFYVVYGRVAIPADIFAACCDTDPGFEYFEVVESDEDHAVVEGKRKRWSGPRRYEVTIQDAVQAGYLDGKHSELWGTYENGKFGGKKRRPRIMLAHMAQREAARLWHPSRFAGLYAPDELVDAPKNVTPLAATVKVADVLRLPESQAAPVAGAVDPGSSTSEERSRLTALHVAELRQLASERKISLDAFEESVGGPLASLESDPGESEEDFFVLLRTALLKMAPAASGELFERGKKKV
jgi:hypothetical protein